MKKLNLARTVTENRSAVVSLLLEDTSATPQCTYLHLLKTHLTNPVRASPSTHAQSNTRYSAGPVLLANKDHATTPLNPQRREDLEEYQRCTYCREPKHPDFPVFAIMVDFSSSKALALVSQLLHLRVYFFKYMICTRIVAAIRTGSRHQTPPNSSATSTLFLQDACRGGGCLLPDRGRGALRISDSDLLPR